MWKVNSGESWQELVSKNSYSSRSSFTLTRNTNRHKKLPSFCRQQKKFCPECCHAVDLGANLPKLYVWNMLINEAASILLFAVTHICSRAKESSRLPCQTSALYNLDNKPDRCFWRSGQSLRTAYEMFYRNSFDLSWTLLMMWLTSGLSVCGVLSSLTCMFVVRMWFLALVTASLLQEESSTLHHEEALAQAAKQGQKSSKSLKHIRRQTNSSANLCQLVL